MENNNAELVKFARDYALQGIDLYDLLGIEDSITSKEDIHRAWKKKSLRLHPDKAGANFDPEKYELVERARNILTDASTKAAYDGARQAQLLRKQRDAAVSVERKRMIDDLEARESAAKRQKQEEKEKEMELEREKMRLREEGLRRIREEQERFRVEQLKAQQPKDELDDQIAALERKIAEKARLKAEKKARKKGGAVPDSAAPPPAPPPAPSEASNGTATGEQKIKKPPIKWADLKAKMLAVQRQKDEKKKQQQEDLRNQGRPGQENGEHIIASEEIATSG
jgi:DnaJ homolog subfamily C member 17